MTLTPATPKDIKKVFDWRNSPDILSKGNGQTVDWTEHAKWYSETLADDDKFLLIIGDDAGAVRLEREDRQAEISVYVMPHHRGEGLGKRAIQEATRLAYATWDVDEVVAIVKADNAQSVKVFIECMYLPAHSKSYGFCRLVNREK